MKFRFQGLALFSFSMLLVACGAESEVAQTPPANTKRPTVGMEVTAPESASPSNLTTGGAAQQIKAQVETAVQQGAQAGKQEMMRQQKLAAQKAVAQKGAMQDAAAKKAATMDEVTAKKLAAKKAAMQKGSKNDEAIAKKLAAKKAAMQKAAAQKGAGAKQDIYGLSPEQEKKRKKILADKAAILSGRAGKSAGYTGPKGEGPRLSLSRAEINFGSVWDTDTMEGKFEFTNTGKSPLVIELVKASCGCTTTELEKMEYAPGESGEIDVSWHPKGFGPQIKTITITSNNEGEQYKRLMIRATIKPFAKWEPEPTRFDSVRIFKEHKTLSELTCVDPNFELVSLVTSNPNLTAVEVERKPNGNRVIELTLGSETPWGMFNASVIAKVRGVRQAGEEIQERDAILHVGGSVFGDLAVKPNLFSVGRVAPKGRISFSVLLTSTDGVDFELIKAEVENSQPPGMTLRSEPNPGGGLRVFVEGDVGDYEGLIRGTAVMETSLAGEGERRLPIMGIVRP